MPHCIIEYSKELEDEIKPSQLIERVYQGTLKSNLFIDKDIKLRTISFENHKIGNEKIDFIHVTVKILTGRSIEDKKALSHIILDDFKDIDIKPLSVTVEVYEIENESYSKLVL